MVLDPGFLACCDCTDNCQVCWATFTLTLSIFWFLDRSVQGGKAQTGYTALIESLTHEIQNTEPRPGARFSKVPKLFGRIRVT